MGTQEIGGTDHEGFSRHAKLFEMLLESIPSSVLLIDHQMRIVAVNKNFVEKNRKSREQAIGAKLQDLLPEPLIEYMDITARVRQVFDNKAATRGGRLTYRAPGVPLRVYYYNIVPFSWRGQVENVMLLMEDVTEQIRLGDEVVTAQRHLAGIVESAWDIILSTDSDGIVLTWNTAAERITGHSTQEVCGSMFVDMFPLETQPEIRRLVKNVYDQGASQIGEWDIMTKDNQCLPVSWILSGMRDESNNTVGIVAIGRDLRERKLLEMELLKSQKLAALGVMAGGIAHEIRNPLAVSYSSAQFLLEDDIDPEFGKVCIQKILTGIHKASTIIEDLLRFARPSSSIDMVQLDLVSIINDCVRLADAQAKTQKVQISVEDQTCEIRVLGHANLLQQVFLNLFLNAMNAMEDGGVLKIWFEKIPIQAVVCISDTGRGIPKQDIEKIFDPFFTSALIGKGTGLGLSLCHSIITKQHQGRIEVESEEGVGSTFRICLPTS
jgi:PAS domain S-box-containing protein